MFSCRWVEGNFAAGLKNSFAVGTKIVFFGGLRFLSSMRLEVSGSLQLETVFHVIYVFNIEQYDTSLHVVIQMKANKFFLVVIANFFD